MASDCQVWHGGHTPLPRRHLSCMECVFAIHCFVQYVNIVSSVLDEFATHHIWWHDRPRLSI